MTWTAGGSVNINSRIMGYSPKHRTLVVSRNGNGTIQASRNGGVSWGAVTLLASNDNYYTKWIEELNLWINLAANGTVSYANQKDVETLWRTGTVMPMTLAFAFAWSPQLGIAVTLSNSLVGYSRNGIDWKTIPGPAGQYNGIEWCAARGMFLATRGAAAGAVYSRDGLKWYTTLITAATGCGALCASDERGEFLTVTTTEKNAILF